MMNESFEFLVTREHYHHAKPSKKKIDNETYLAERTNHRKETLQVFLPIATL